MIRKLVLSLIALRLATCPAPAAMITLENDDYAKNTQLLLNEIAVAQGLSAKEMIVAQSVAGTWVYVGPCRGKLADRDRALAADALYFLAPPSPRRPFHAAILQMIAVINLDDFGSATERACKLAFEKSGMKGPDNGAPSSADGRNQ